MKAKTKKIEKEETESGWKIIVQNFVSEMLARVGDSISERITVWVNDLKRRTTGAIFMIIGLIFCLIGAVAYINTLLGDGMQWVGFVAVGAVVTGAGLLLNRK